MDNCKFLCGQCNNGYKNKSSLRRHINSAHNNRRFVCGHCQKEYMRKVDFVKHTTNYHQPLILNQGPENIDVTQTNQPSVSSTTNHSISNTTAVLTGETDWTKILQQDMELSSDDEDSPLKVSIGMTTGIQTHPDKTTGCNTSPLGILDLEPTQYVTTHKFPEDVKKTLIIKSKPTTQIGCVPISINTNSQTQTEEVKCDLCTHEEHLIIKRQNYIIADAIKNISGKYTQPINSREDRHKMPLPGSTKHKEWLKKFQPDLKPRSPREFQRPKNSPKFVNPEIKISSTPQTTASKVRKPSALTIDHDTYLAICSRKKTNPTLVSSPRRIILPPPPANGAWEYRTTKF